jgi:hypothetical protein
VVLKLTTPTPENETLPFYPVSWGDN